MKRITRIGLALAAAALFLLPNPVSAQVVDPTIADPTFPEVRFYAESRSISPGQVHQYAQDVSDPAFDVYVSPGILSQAFLQQDPELLTDVALQITEGERVLLRSRKGITAEQSLNLAVSVAIERNAQDALVRLSKAAKAMGNEKLAAQIAESEKLAAATRSDDAFMIPIDSISPEQYTELYNGVQALRFAKLCGDGRAIDEIGKSFERMPACCEPHLKKLLADARTAAASGALVDPQLRAFLAKLAAVSRVPVDSDGGTSRREDTASDEAVEVSGTF